MNKLLFMMGLNAFANGSNISTEEENMATQSAGLFLSASNPQTYDENVWNNNIYDTVEFDPHGLVDPTYSFFTAPPGATWVSFEISQELAIDSVLSAYRFYVRSVDSDGLGVGNYALSNGSTNPQGGNVTGRIPCRAGDTFKIQTNPFRTALGGTAPSSDFFWVTATFGFDKTEGLTMYRSKAKISTANQALSSLTDITWETEVVDELGCLTAGSVNIVFPSGYQYFQIMSMLQGTQNSTAYGIGIKIVADYSADNFGSIYLPVMISTLALPLTFAKTGLIPAAGLEGQTGKVQVQGSGTNFLDVGSSVHVFGWK